MNSALKKSIVLHVVVFLLFVIEMPMFWWYRTQPSQVPIIVDLKDVKISEMTNLPPKAKIGKEDKEASRLKRKIEKKYTKSEQKIDTPEPEQEEVKNDNKKVEPTIKPEPPKKDFMVAPQPKKPQVSTKSKKAEKKSKPKKTENKKVVKEAKKV